MPPWYIEKDIGIQHYKNDISLSDEEIAKIAAWADSGAPRGQSRRHAGAAARLPIADALDDRHAGSRRRHAAGQHEGRQPRLVGQRRVRRHRVSTEDRYVAAVEIKEVNDSQRQAAGRRRPSAGCSSSTTRS